MKNRRVFLLKLFNYHKNKELNTLMCHKKIDSERLDKYNKN